MNIVTLKNYELHSKTTGSRLQNFNLSLMPGQAYTLIADDPDQAHLLIRALATLIRPQAGEYNFKGAVLDFSHYRNLLDAKRQIGYFGPNAALLSNVTVRENLLLSRAYFENTLDLSLGDTVEELCAEFHLTDKLDLRPTAMSPLDIRAAILVREFTKPLELFIMDSPEDLIGQLGFSFLIKKLKNRIADGLPFVLLCENDELTARLTRHKIRLPKGAPRM